MTIFKITSADMNNVLTKNGYSEGFIHKVINFSKPTRRELGQKIFVPPDVGQSSFIIQKLLEKLDPKINVTFGNLSTLQKSIFLKIASIFVKTDAII